MFFHIKLNYIHEKERFQQKHCSCTTALHCHFIARTPGFCRSDETPIVQDFRKSNGQHVMHIDLRHLRTMEALAETGSLTTAAERLHLTQSALSHQLKALEAQLDAPLFVRKSRPLRLTRQGARLLELAREVLPRVEAARRDLHRMSCGETVRLFIAIECHSCFAWLMPAMDRYRHLWPEVEMDLTTSFAFDPLPALARGELDLVVTSDQRPIPGITYEPLFGYQALLALASDHPLVEQKRLNIDYNNLWDLGWRLSELIPVEEEKKQALLELDAAIAQLLANADGIPGGRYGSYSAPDNTIVH
jgi:LysR family transcriptional regulator for metE and metH